MTQPKFAPIGIADEVRPANKLEVPRPWSAHRPAEHRRGAPIPTRGSAAPGPDQGYALQLAKAFRERLVLGPAEHADDALALGVAIALRRASRIGRAPVAPDIEAALTLLGYLTAVDPAAQGRRHELVSGVAHDAWQRLAFAGAVPDDLVAMSPDEARAHPLDWMTFQEP